MVDYLSLHILQRVLLPTRAHRTPAYTAHAPLAEVGTRARVLEDSLAKTATSVRLLAFSLRLHYVVFVQAFFVILPLNTCLLNLGAYRIIMIALSAPCISAILKNLTARVTDCFLPRMWSIGGSIPYTR